MRATTLSQHTIEKVIKGKSVRPHTLSIIWSAVGRIPAQVLLNRLFFCSG